MLRGAIVGVDRWIGIAALLAFASGCPGGAETTPRPNQPFAKQTDTKPVAKQTDAKPDAKADPKPDAKADPKPPEDTARGRVLEGPLPIASMLGKAPADVQALLGKPLGKGMIRKSCVRFLPERTWFECQFATQRYGDQGDSYTAIAVEYQDGKSTAVAFDGLRKATGDFDTKLALAYVGLELPGEPKIETPGGDATVAVWFNSAARLLIDGRQYRVIVSTVANDWARTKVEVILNDPLDEAEAAKKIEKPTPADTAP